jgi:hypothetical protein
MIGDRLRTFPGGKRHARIYTKDRDEESEREEETHEGVWGPFIKKKNMQGSLVMEKN